MSNDLRILRDRLDDVDRRIVEALAERQRVVGEVSRVKAEAGVSPVRDQEREASLLVRVAALADAAGADPALLTRLYREILAASVQWQLEQRDD